MAALITGKIDIRAKKTTRVRELNYIIIKRSAHPEEITILNVSTKMIELKVKIDKSAIIVENLKHSLLRN